MKHAGPAALDRLEPLLKTLRRDPRLKEKSRGTFYRAGRAFLHFHEHGDDELFADVRLGDDFERFPATKAAERSALLKVIAKTLGPKPSNDGNAAPVRSTSLKRARN
jgi:hypothetical protein